MRAIHEIPNMLHNVIGRIYLKQGVDDSFKTPYNQFCHFFMIRSYSSLTPGFYYLPSSLGYGGFLPTDHGDATTGTILEDR